MAVAVIAVVIGVAMIMMVVIIMAVVMAAAAVMAPGKGSRENPEKSSPRKKGRFPSGLLTQDGARVGVVGTPINISPI